MAVQTRLPFELDQRAETGFITAHGGVPLLLEAFRTSGAAAVVDTSGVIKRRKRGLAPSQLVEGLFSLWAAGAQLQREAISGEAPGPAQRAGDAVADRWRDEHGGAVAAERVRQIQPPASRSGWR